jgi:cysteine-rich repeat protein
MRNIIDRDPALFSIRAATYAARAGDRVLACILAIVAHGACVDQPYVTCETGVVCPGDQECSLHGDFCTDDGCGNGRVDHGEACDDGNRLSGDGCSADCLSKESCGNGIRDVQEQCDDKNHLAGDGCSPTCLLEGCGNGEKHPYETCDDNNNVNGDGCSADCLSDESCGNTYVDVAKGETCDDGNTDSNDGCSATCKDENCGNGRVDVGELCDDGNNDNGDDCSADCRSKEECGNRIRDVDEECDDGNVVNGDGCNAVCSREVCGNGARDFNEACDDGNQVSGDGCSADCQSNEICGDGIVDHQAREQCDDGNVMKEDGCSESCQLENCGNGMLDRHETCDDGNNISRDGCSADCLSDETCGNGVVDPTMGEICDDGNTSSGDGCNADCKSGATCGNGYIDPAAGEVCDDGNNSHGDNCSADCRSNETCGNGTLDLAVGEVCDDGNNTHGDGCSATCRSDESCGNNVVDLDEVCDDGNNISGDDCSADCRSDETCDNGKLDLAKGEVCDDGNNISGDGCSADCRSNETCGNETVDTVIGEVCDDGNNINGDDCSADCGSDESCGNGIVDLAAGEECDGGNQDAGDGCSSTCNVEVCGNVIVDPGEACDDGNETSGDGCEVDCTITGPVEIVAGGFHTCVRLWTGAVRCWGRNNEGQLGHGHSLPIGDNEVPSTAGDVDVGGPVIQLAAGFGHTCALLQGGAVRCWGVNVEGQLGYGHTNPIGDNELPSAAGDVDVGGPVVAIAAGDHHMCALLEGGALRCWGHNNFGQLGYGHTNDIGDDELPITAGDVNVGGTVVAIGAGDFHTCALLEGGALRCWGRNDFGQLGYGHTSSVLAPGANVNVGGPVIALGMGDFHTCALLEEGTVRCWGRNDDGQLGYGHTNDIGDGSGEMPPANVQVGGSVVAVRGGDAHTCALLQNGTVRCWGFGDFGQLGYGSTATIGDGPGEMPPGDVDVGDGVIELAVGELHTCALLATHTVRCWGNNADGQLGYGHPNRIGDNERPSSSSVVHIVDSQ